MLFSTSSTDEDAAILVGLSLLIASSDTGRVLQVLRLWKESELTTL
jgi:hypothetical protein